MHHRDTRGFAARQGTFGVEAPVTAARSDESVSFHWFILPRPAHDAAAPARCRAAIARRRPNA